MPEPVLKLDHIAVSLRSADGALHEITRDVSLSLAEREIVSIVGPSGSGKTTLLRAASGLREPSGGSASFAGKPVDGVPTGLSIVFQEYNKSLFPWLTVGKNVAMGARSMSKKERQERAEEALARVGLKGLSSRYPWELSGGMQQRTALARAMVSQPRLLMMDEPFASVDALTRNHLEDMVLDIWSQSNFAILMVTHDVGEAVYLSDRVLVLSARPSAVLAEIKVDLPRPRTQLETRSSKAFVELQAQVLERVEHAGRRAVGLVADEA
ncbi:MAG: ABC transporter ATP-binding protein [Actinomycetota bacterium]|nr:ABC transporter ATP-binding protein [Actinomycetota bacterium]